MQERADREVYALLRRSVVSINRLIRVGVRDELRRGEMIETKRQLELEMAALMRRVGDVTKARQHDAAARAVTSNATAERRWARQAGISPITFEEYQQNVERKSRENVLNAMAKTFGRSNRPLSKKVIDTTKIINGQLDRFIETALVTNMDVDQFARGVRGFIRPDVPGGASYAALRLARNEIANAFHATQIVHAQQQPFITGCRWELSGSHSKSKSDCMCPVYAGKIYPPDQVPNRPHPGCLCTLSYETDVSVFLSMLD